MERKQYWEFLGKTFEGIYNRDYAEEKGYLSKENDRIMACFLIREIDTIKECFGRDVKYFLIQELNLSLQKLLQDKGVLFVPYYGEIYFVPYKNDPKLLHNLNQMIFHYFEKNPLYLTKGFVENMKIQTIKEILRYSEDKGVYFFEEPLDIVCSVDLYWEDAYKNVLRAERVLLKTKELNLYLTDISYWGALAKEVIDRFASYILYPEFLKFLKLSSLEKRKHDYELELSETKWLLGLLLAIEYYRKERLPGFNVLPKISISKTMADMTSEELTDRMRGIVMQYIEEYDRQNMAKELFYPVLEKIIQEKIKFIR